MITIRYRGVLQKRHIRVGPLTERQLVGQALVPALLPLVLFLRRILALVLRHGPAEERETLGAPAQGDRFPDGLRRLLRTVLTSAAEISNP